MRWPVDRPRITPHGAYDFVRVAKNFCGGKPPCVHHGLDLGGVEGTPVYAPESGLLVYAFEGDATRPFSRFGPAGVVLQGVTSGDYHLLMHLSAPTVFTAQQAAGHATRLAGTIAVLEGQQVGTISDRRHVHWEVRRDPADRSTHVDPLGVLQLYGDASLTDRTPAAPAAQTRPAKAGGGRILFGILLLLALRRRR